MTMVQANISNKWVTRKKEVLSNSFVVIDSITFENFKGAKYLIQLSNDTEDVFLTMELLVSRVKGSNLYDTIYAKLGDSINVEINTEINLPDMILKVTNNESYNLLLVVNRLNLTQ